MKQTQLRSFEQTNDLIAALNAFKKENDRVTEIPTMPSTSGKQYLIGDTTLVLTYHLTAQPSKEILHEWYSLDASGMREAKALVQDAYRLSKIPFTEETHCD